MEISPSSCESGSARHIDSCTTCTDEQRQRVNPVALLGGASIHSGPRLVATPDFERRPVNVVELRRARPNPAPAGNRRVGAQAGLLVGIPLVVLGFVWFAHRDTPVEPRVTIGTDSHAPDHRGCRAPRWWRPVLAPRSAAPTIASVPTGQASTAPAVSARASRPAPRRVRLPALRGRPRHRSGDVRTVAPAPPPAPPAPAPPVPAPAPARRRRPNPFPGAAASRSGSAATGQPAGGHRGQSECHPPWTQNDPGFFRPGPSPPTGSNPGGLEQPTGVQGRLATESGHSAVAGHAVQPEGHHRRLRSTTIRCAPTTGWENRKKCPTGPPNAPTSEGGLSMASCKRCRSSRLVMA